MARVYHASPVYGGERYRSFPFQRPNRICPYVDRAEFFGVVERGDNDPDWVYWLNREEIDVMAGRCYTELGRPAQAEKLLTGAIGRYDQTLIRENSLYLSWLAEDYVQLGEVEHAADMATRMAILAGQTNSARADTLLHFLVGRLRDSPKSV